MENRNLYISILVIGSVFAVLTLLTDSDSLVALSIFYLTILTILVMRLIIEWRWYRSHNAPYASEFFLILISIIALSSSLLAQNITLGYYFDLRLQQIIMSISVDLNIFSAGNYLVFLNRFGLLIVMPFMVILILLLRKYYTGRYPVIFVNRKRFKKEFVFLYSFIVILLLVFFWIRTETIELGSLLFVLTIIIFLIQKYLLRVVLIPLQTITPSRNRRTSEVTRTRATRTSGTRNRSRPQGNSTRNLINITSRNRTRTSSRATQSTTTNRSSSNTFVVPGLDNQETTARKTTTKKLSATSLKRIIPIGIHLTEEDFRCIFCYQFPTETKVVICPHCHHAAHEHEFIKWRELSKLCSRCNKLINNSEIIKISGKDYGRLIAMFKQRKLQN